MTNEKLIARLANELYDLKISVEFDGEATFSQAVEAYIT